MLAPYVVWQKHRTLEDDNYIPKNGHVIAWSMQVVKAVTYKILFVLKLGIHNNSHGLLCRGGR